MRPIDTIRTRMDSDFVKYHSSTLCVIKSEADVKDVPGVGLCALVTPLNRYKIVARAEEDADPISDEDTYTVLLINRPAGWMESHISSKYLVMTLNPIEDRTMTSMGFLVPLTALNDLDVFRKAEANDRPTDQKGNPLVKKTKENLPSEITS